MSTSPINYSQCWEDPDVLVKALMPQTGSRVFSITSGGDNVLALIIAGVECVDAVDFNPVQNYLLELKFAAAQALEYEQYLAFLGVRDSQTRVADYDLVSGRMSAEACAWWSEHVSLIADGVVHAGRFESFTRRFARRILPWIHSRKIVERLLLCTSFDEQRSVYDKEWNTALWRLMFGLATSRVLLRRFARQRGMFAHTAGESVAEVYRARLSRHIARVSVSNNYFLRYSMTGEYGATLPPYLTREGYEVLHRGHSSAISMHALSATEYLRLMPDGTFSAFNLSDIFEALSVDESESLWSEIIRTARPGARVAYWTNLVPRSVPERFATAVLPDVACMEAARTTDRVFFYATFQAHTIRTI